MLPIPYFHIVFTTDHAINALARANPRAIYDLLFHAATDTLKAYGQRYLGGELGITAVLHTWGQQLQEHVHLHTLVTGGALGHTAGKWHWRASAENFLFPIVAVSATFRDKFCAGVLRLSEHGVLTIPAGLDVPTLVAQMQAKNWEVYVRVARGRETDGGAEKVLDYADADVRGRYTNRIAISNYRLTRITPWKVTFRYYDNRAGGVEKELTLGVLEFMRRFLQHVLPKGYMRIRHYGLHHNRKRGALSMARKLLGLTVHLPEPPPLERETWLAEILAEDPQRCPFCGTGTMVAWRPFGAIQGMRALAWQVLGLDLRGAVSR